MSKQINFRLLHQLSGHAGPIYALGADADFLYTGSADGMVASWHIDRLESAQFSIKVGQAVYSLCLHDQRLLIGQGEGGIHVIDRQEKRELRHLKYHTKGVFDIQYHAAQNQFYTTGGDGKFTVFSGDDYRLMLQLPLSVGKLRRMAIHPEESQLAISSSDGMIRILDADYFNELANFHAHTGGAYGLFWLDDQTLVSGGRDGYIRFWQIDLKTGGWSETAAIPAHNFAVYDLFPISDHLFASASRDKSVKIWNTESLMNPQKLTYPSRAHLRSVNAVSFVQGKLWSAGDDGILSVWAEDALN